MVFLLSGTKIVLVCAGVEWTKKTCLVILQITYISVVTVTSVFMGFRFFYLE